MEYVHVGHILRKTLEVWSISCPVEYLERAKMGPEGHGEQRTPSGFQGQRPAVWSLWDKVPQNPKLLMNKLPKFWAGSRGLQRRLSEQAAGGQSPSYSNICAPTQGHSHICAKGGTGEDHKVGVWGGEVCLINTGSVLSRGLGEVVSLCRDKS